MKKLLAILFLIAGYSVTAQNITYKQLVPLSNYVAMKIYSTNGLAWNALSLTNDNSDFTRWTQGHPDNNGVILDNWSIGDNSVNAASTSFTWDIFAIKSQWGIDSGNYGPLLYFDDSGNETHYTTVSFQNNIEVFGIAYDASGIPYANLTDSSNNVQVVSGTGTSVVPSGSGAVMTYTVNFTGGGGATNAISFVNTNGTNVGTGLTGLNFTNTPDIFMSGTYSNNGAAFVLFSLNPTVRSDATNYTDSRTVNISNALANINVTNAAQEVLIEKLTNVGFGLAWNGTNLSVNLVVTNAAFATNSLYAKTATNLIAGGSTAATHIGITNVDVYDFNAGGFVVHNSPAIGQSMLELRSEGTVGSEVGAFALSFQGGLVGAWSFTATTNDFAITAGGGAFAGPVGNSAKVIASSRNQHSISIAPFVNAATSIYYITNDANVYNPSNVYFRAQVIAPNITYNLHSAASGTAFNINFNTNKYYLTLAGNVALTNYTGLTSTNGEDTTLIFLPSGANRTVTYPTLGGNSFGVHAFTNANSPMWTTLTQNIAYAISVSAFGSNTFWAITEWK